jgi:amino-acid N-acetyltransferase
MTVSVEPRVRGADPADTTAVRELLNGAQLPVADLDRAAGLRIWVVEEDNHLVGAIGLERSGTAGLLRSLVVTRSCRQRGLGRALVLALEREARLQGIEQLVLLTQTAEAFFLQAGYGVVDRSVVPDSIRRLEEFQTLCPASAVCMRKILTASRNGADD